MTKTISINFDERHLDQIDEAIKELGIDRNEYIIEAINHYHISIRKNKIKEQLIKEIPLIQESSLDVLKEFEAIND